MGFQLGKKKVDKCNNFFTGIISSIDVDQWVWTMNIFALISMVLRSLYWLAQTSATEKMLAITLTLSCCFLLYSLSKQYVERYVGLSKI